MTTITTNPTIITIPLNKLVPSAANARRTGQQMGVAAMMADAGVSPGIAIASLPKKEAVAVAARALAGAGWLPEVLRSPDATEPDGHPIRRAA